MTQEQKELLLKDLCARLPYGVKMNHIADDEYSPKTLIGVAKDMITLEGLGGYECIDIEDYKPYLFPLSSMTDEMIECKVEDTITTNEQLFEPSNISLEKEMEWNLPEGYQFKDENGNVINATKIVLEKKKEYPKTYEE